MLKVFDNNFSLLLFSAYRFSPFSIFFFFGLLVTFTFCPLRCAENLHYVDGRSATIFRNFVNCCCCSALNAVQMDIEFVCNGILASENGCMHIARQP